MSYMRRVRPMSLESHVKPWHVDLLHVVTQVRTLNMAGVYRRWSFCLLALLATFSQTTAWFGGKASNQQPLAVESNEKALLDWLTAGGAKLAVTISRSKEGYRGTFASKNLQHGDDVAVIPLTRCIHLPKNYTSFRCVPCTPAA